MSNKYSYGRISLYDIYRDFDTQINALEEIIHEMSGTKSSENLEKLKDQLREIAEALRVLETVNRVGDTIKFVETGNNDQAREVEKSNDLIEKTTAKLRKKAKKIISLVDRNSSKSIICTIKSKKLKKELLSALLDSTIQRDDRLKGTHIVKFGKNANSAYSILMESPAQLDLELMDEEAIADKKTAKEKPLIDKLIYTQSRTNSNITQAAYTRKERGEQGDKIAAFIEHYRLLNLEYKRLLMENPTYLNIHQREYFESILRRYSKKYQTAIQLDLFYYNLEENKEKIKELSNRVSTSDRLNPLIDTLVKTFGEAIGYNATVKSEFLSSQENIRMFDDFEDAYRQLKISEQRKREIKNQIYQLKYELRTDDARKARGGIGDEGMEPLELLDKNNELRTAEKELIETEILPFTTLITSIEKRKEEQKRLKNR